MSIVIRRSRPFWACLALSAVAVAMLAGSVLAQARRQLAPGVLTVIPSAPQEEEMFSGPAPLIEIATGIADLEYTPNFEAKNATIFERAKASTLRRTIWNLEFAFKPMRMIEVDVPRADGRLERKLIWYMVYRVKNNGGHWKPKEVVAETASPNLTSTTYTKELTNEVELFGKTTTDLRFFPKFVLHSTEYDKNYLDRVIPAALDPIRRREFPGTDQKLHDSASIAEVPIPVSDETHDRSVWGVVTWDDIDPRIDYFSVFIQGLTNAYKSVDGDFKAGDPPGTGRQLLAKTLQLNFWRPGDAVEQKEEEIRYGVRIDTDPAVQQEIFEEYGVKERLDHLWVYR